MKPARLRGFLVSSLLLLVICLVLGVAVARWARPPTGMAPALHWWVLNVALPAVTLALIPPLVTSRALWFLVVPHWLGLAGAASIFSVVGPRLGWSRARTGGVILVAGLGNTSFIGFPLLEALRGPSTLPYAVVADQLGAFVALSVGGVLVAARFSGEAVSARAVVWRVVTFPPLLALAMGLVVGATGGWPPVITETLLRLGSTLSPLALFSVGLRLELRIARDHGVPLALALGWKLALLPLLAWGLGTLAGVHGPVFVVGVLQAAMAPMISAAILAERDGLDPPLANTILAVGIVLAFGTVALVSALLP